MHGECFMLKFAQRVNSRLYNSVANVCWFNYGGVIWTDSYAYVDEWCAFKKKAEKKGGREREEERARISRSALVKTLLLTFVHLPTVPTIRIRETLEQDNEADGKVLSVFRNFSWNYRKDDESSWSRIKVHSESSIAIGQLE